MSTTLGQLPTNDCDRLREQVSASLDGELSQLESARLQTHLAGCASCRSFAATAGMNTLAAGLNSAFEKVGNIIGHYIS